MTANRFDRAAVIGAVLLAIASLIVAFAPSAGAADPCPNAAFRTGVAAGLPDCRAYEIVSQPQKVQDLNLGLAARPLSWAAADGSRVFYVAFLEGGASGNFADRVITERTENGWKTMLRSPADEPGIRSYDSTSGGPVASDLSGFVGVYFQASVFNEDLLPSELQIVKPEGKTVAATGPGFLFPSITRPSPVAASDDLSHVFYEQAFPEDLDPQTIDPPPADVVPGARVLYEWVDGQRKIVGANSDGTLLNPCGSWLGSKALSGGRANSVSADGSTVFFNVPGGSGSDPSCEVPRRVYVQAGDAPPVWVSKPVSGVSDPNGPQAATFAGVSKDGEVAFFTTAEQLTPDDSPGSHQDLYQYDTSSGELKLITQGPDGHADAGVIHVHPTEDGSAVYVLVERPMVAGTGIEGEPNLYRYDVGSGSWSFIATLSQSQARRISVNGSGLGYDGTSVESGWYTPPTGGRFLLFASDREPLDGGGEQAQQLYRYDGKEETLTCVSCVLGVAHTGGAGIGGAMPAEVNRYNRPMTDDGQRVFFDTPTALVPADGNQVPDVYEWHDGVVSLISGGTDQNESGFLSASADGRDVFFGTRQKLVAQDQDDLADIYDARIGGGFGSDSGGALCDGADCSVAATPPLRLARAASAGVHGNGNAKPRRGNRKLRLKAPGPAERTRAAETGLLRLTVKVPYAGHLTASATARIGADQRRVAHLTRKVGQAGSVLLSLHLSDRAQTALARRERLRLSIKVAVSGAAHTQKSILVSLRRSR